MSDKPVLNLIETLRNVLGPQSLAIENRLNNVGVVAHRIA